MLSTSKPASPPAQRDPTQGTPKRRSLSAAVRAHSTAGLPPHSRRRKEMIPDPRPATKGEFPLDRTWPRLQAHIHPKYIATPIMGRRLRRHLYGPEQIRCNGYSALRRPVLERRKFDGFDNLTPQTPYCEASCRQAYAPTP